MIIGRGFIVRLLFSDFSNFLKSLLKLKFLCFEFFNLLRENRIAFNEFPRISPKGLLLLGLVTYQSTFVQPTLKIHYYNLSYGS